MPDRFRAPVDYFTMFSAVCQVLCQFFRRIARGGRFLPGAVRFSGAGDPGLRRATVGCGKRIRRVLDNGSESGYNEGTIPSRGTIMGIEKNLQKLRASLNMTQEAFAEMTGVSRQAVQKWENGSARPDLDRIILIAKLFNVSVDALLLNSD